MKKVPFKILALIISLTCISACGIKPKDVSPPKGMEDSQFPREYPDLETDPAPGLDQKNNLKNQ